MPTLREVRSRISGVKKTEKITRAMKMVAAAKLRRAQAAVLAARPYANGMKRLLQHLLPAIETGSEPLLTPRPVRTLAIIAVTSDRGMCGAFNTNIIRAAQERIATAVDENGQHIQVRLYCLGKKGVDFFTRQRMTLAARYPGIFAKLVFGDSQKIVREVADAFLRGEIDRVEIAYNEFKSAVRQQIVVEQYLPIVPEAQELAQAAASTRIPNYIYEPSQQSLMSALLPRYLNFTLWRVLLESSAAEEGARMTAMENATENANEMIDTLQLQYNKARQTAITKELLEVVSGAEALRGAS
jgi:F-type H+-transporting ATPase subunit gamma